MAKNPDRLFSIAESQRGYFTTAQAVDCGYPTSNHVYHLKAGSWTRMHRGIYRLTRFPQSDDEQYVLWSLWSRNRQGIPQGVYSHQTALSLFDLSDLMPRRLHMMVPPAFRRNASIPNVLVLHKGTLRDSEIETRQGYRVTRPLKAIADLLEESGGSKEHLALALQQGLARGLIIRKDIKGHPNRPALEALMGVGTG